MVAPRPGGIRRSIPVELGRADLARDSCRGIKEEKEEEREPGSWGGGGQQR